MPDDILTIRLVIAHIVVRDPKEGGVLEVTRSRYVLDFPLSGWSVDLQRKDLANKLLDLLQEVTEKRTAELGAAYRATFMVVTAGAHEGLTVGTPWLFQAPAFVELKNQAVAEYHKMKGLSNNTHTTLQ